MSFKNRGGNIGKIKYFLPARKPLEELENAPNKKAPASFLDSDSKPERRHSKNRSSMDRLQERRPRQPSNSGKHHESIEVDVVGIKDVSVREERPDVREDVREEAREEGRPGIFDMFPEESEKEQFFEFLQGLKTDQDYQNSITMFTIMYYYQKKQEQGRRCA